MNKAFKNVTPASFPAGTLESAEEKKKKQGCIEEKADL